MYQTRTKDRWTLALHRYRVLLPTLARRFPVLLCHGLGSNRHSFDAPQGPSLARYLAERGFDVWSLELRGAGRSARPHLFNRLEWEWTFEHYVRYDAPAALAFVRDVTGAERVHWVGHSLGGMVAYALLVNQEAPLVSLTTLASPTVGLASSPQVPAAKVVGGVLARLRRVPAGVTARLGAPLTSLTYRFSLFRYLYNSDNVDPAVIRSLLRCALDDVPSRLLLDYLTAYEARRAGAHHSVFDYEQRLDRIGVPLYLLGGEQDGLCPPDHLEAIYQRVSSATKRMRVVGRASGCRHDYGHHDLLLGRHAADEVFADITRWLTERDRGAVARAA